MRGSSATTQACVGGELCLELGLKLMEHKGNGQFSEQQRKTAWSGLESDGL